MNYTNLFHSYIFFQRITKPTRVTCRFATLIDHVWTNYVNNYIRSSILYIILSDHFPLWSLFSTSLQANSDSIDITKRIYNSNSICNFRESLKSYQLDLELTNVKGAENILNLFISKFKKLKKNYFPVKSYLVKKKHLGNPYITSGIMKSRKHWNKLQKLYARWSLTYDTIFRNYRNTLTTVIPTAKENYYKSKLSQVI